MMVHARPGCSGKIRSGRQLPAQVAAIRLEARPGLGEQPHELVDEEVVEDAVLPEPKFPTSGWRRLRRLSPRAAEGVRRVVDARAEGPVAAVSGT